MSQAATATAITAIPAGTATRRPKTSATQKLAEASIVLAQYVEDRLAQVDDVRDAPPPEAPSPSMAEVAADLDETLCDVRLERGLEACRAGDWSNGLRDLRRAATDSRRGTKMPALCLSYLGYGLASKEKRVKEGLKLCRKAVQLEFFQTEGYVNLARTYLLAGQRAEAIEAVREGLRIDVDNVELNALQVQLGARRAPVLSFLDRGHPLNRLLGRIRFELTGSPKT